MSAGGNVGVLRGQLAYVESTAPVILVSKDPQVHAFLQGLKIVNVYPDTTDALGKWDRTFKIEVAAKELTG